MPNADDDQKTNYDAIFGRLNQTQASSNMDPELGRVKVKLGGTLASDPLAPEIATEIVALVERARVKIAAKDDPGGHRSAIEVSFRGLGLSPEAEHELAQTIREFVGSKLINERR
jgi:hypothetical protein